MFWLIGTGDAHIIFNMSETLRQGVAYPQTLAARDLARYFE
jgi:hypothetical protein